jgi:hypothetical protein
MVKTWKANIANPLMRSGAAKGRGQGKQGLWKHSLGGSAAPGMPYTNKSSAGWLLPPGMRLMETRANYRQSNAALERMFLL